MFKSKKFWYILLFSILYLIVAFSSFFHAVSFFGLANNIWMSVILAFAFEIGQAAVLFSLLTSKKDRSRIMPWVLMTMFTLVQVIGNIYSSYKYIITNSSENLRFFKEPIFIWTDIPDNQANVIIVYLVGALLPIASLLLTSMITNYLTDEEEAKEEAKQLEIKEEIKGEPKEETEEVFGSSEKIEEEQEQIDEPEEIIEEPSEEIVETPEEVVEIPEEVVETSKEVIETPKEVIEEKYIPDENELKEADAMISGQMLNEQKQKKKIESHFINN